MEHLTKVAIFFNLLSSNYLIDFMEYFLRQCISDADKEASSEQPSQDDECSDSFAADISDLQDRLLWTSPNYKLVSEYASSMSLSDSDTSKLLVLVSLSHYCVFYFVCVVSLGFAHALQFLYYFICQLNTFLIFM